MANVTKPIALDESIHTTENTPRNIADVVAEELVGIKQAIGNVINLSNCRQMNYASYEQLTPAQKVGAIVVTDYPVSESVSVTADGVKSYGTLLNELYALVDLTKITNESTILNGMDVFTIIRIESDLLIYELTQFYNQKVAVNEFQLKSSNSSFAAFYDGSYINQSSNIVPNGKVLTLYYNCNPSTAQTKPVMLVNGSVVGEFATDADYVSYGNGTVKDALDDMFVQTTVTPNISIPAQGYNFYSYDKPDGYKLISVNMEQNSLAIFSQITNFGNTDRISFFNAYTQAITLEHSITLTFVKL